MIISYEIYTSYSPTFIRCLNHVLVFEGGYVNNPKDPGGATNHGITQEVYTCFKGEYVHVKNLTEEEVVKIYYEQYWTPICGEKLPYPLCLCLFDFAVNSGVTRAVKTLQKILAVEPDGHMGMRTLSKIKEFHPREITNKVIDDREKFMKGLTTWKHFKNGWSNRIKNLRLACTEIQTLEQAKKQAKSQPLNISDYEGRKALGKNISFMRDKFVMGISGLGTAELLNVFNMLENFESNYICAILGFLIVCVLIYMMCFYVKDKKEN